MPVKKAQTEFARMQLIAFLFSSLPLMFSVAAFAGADPIFKSTLQIQSQSSFSRLILALDDSFKPTLKDEKNGFEIDIPNATLMDIGVAFGTEAEFRSYVQSVRDSKLIDLQVLEKESMLIIKGKYKFPTGAQSFAHPEMEKFEFRQREQGKFVLDFWYKKGPTVVEAALLKRKDAIKDQNYQKDAMIKKDVERTQTRERRIQDARAEAAFCDQPFDKKNSVFLRFKPDHPLFNFSAYFPEKIPDHRFEYTSPKGDTEEAQMVRLALKLSKENNHALVVKTIEFLEKEYPKSRYLKEMYFLKANSFYRLGMDDKGKELLSDVAKQARGSEVGLQSAAFLAVQAYNRQEWLFALNSFSSIRRDMPSHPLTWLFRLGSAECLYQIKQADQAREEYAWVANNAPKAQIKAEAAFKVGDVYVDRNQYALAIQSYAAAVKKYESSLAQYPNVLMNLAESYFQLEEFKRAGETYAKFMVYGKNHPNAWRASLRIAELGILNQRQSEITEKAFTETVNHYPMSPGAVIARLRLLPCGNHGGFDLAGVQRFMNSPEVQNFDASESMYSTNYKELVSLTEVRTYFSFADDEKSIESAITHLRENPSVEVRQLIERVMIAGIKRLLASQFATGNGYKAIATYEKYGDYLPLPSHDPEADDLRIKLAQFAAEKNFKNLALEIIEAYRHVNEVEQKELFKAVEKSLVLESSQGQEERLILELKTAWNGDSFKVTDSETSDQFLAKLTLIRDQSAVAFERDLLKALFFEEKKDYQKASEVLGKAMGHMAKMNEVERAQVYNFAAEIAKNNEDFTQAARFFKLAREDKKKASEKDLPELAFRRLVSCPSISSLYASQGEMLEHDQKWKEAVALYAEAIENKVGGNRILYAHAKAILKEGGRGSKVTASRSLEKIKQSQDDDVWKNLALKTLDEIAKEGEVNEKRKP